MLQFLNQYIVAFRRVQDFVIHKPDITPVERREGDDIGIRIVDGEFKWDPTSNQNDSPTLKDINIEIKKGELVMIVGAVGSGKSSLLMAILGEIPKIKGNVQITGKLAYVSQEVLRSVVNCQTAHPTSF
jgi:ABC-type bacteriocin/lantibiotic exporter with double-glycine peptidase domain